MKEIKYLHELLKLISVNYSKNILVLDIDNTILKTETSLGSDQWYSWQSQLIISNDNSAVADNQQQLNQIINHMYSYLNYELCESETPKTLSKFRQNNFEIILLTARGDQGHQHLISSLQKLHISKYLNNHFFSFDSKNSTFKEGILYCNGGNKGVILRNFFEQNNYYPEQILFIDDKLKNLLHVKDSLPQTYIYLYTNQNDNIELFHQRSKQEVIKEYEYYCNYLDKKLK